MEQLHKLKRSRRSEQGSCYLLQRGNSQPISCAKTTACSAAGESYDELSTSGWARFVSVRGKR
jgi:hypothetical protein